MVCKVNHMHFKRLKIKCHIISQNRDNQQLHNKMSVFQPRFILFVNVLFHGNKYGAYLLIFYAFVIFFFINLLLERQKIIKYK